MGTRWRSQSTDSTIDLDKPLPSRVKRSVHASDTASSATVLKSFRPRRLSRSNEQQPLLPSRGNSDIGCIMTPGWHDHPSFGDVSSPTAGEASSICNPPFSNDAFSATTSHTLDFGQQMSNLEHPSIWSQLPNHSSDGTVELSCLKRSYNSGRSAAHLYERRKVTLFTISEFTASFFTRYDLTTPRISPMPEHWNHPECEPTQLLALNPPREMRTMIASFCYIPLAASGCYPDGRPGISFEFRQCIGMRLQPRTLEQYSLWSRFRARHTRSLFLTKQRGLSLNCNLADDKFVQNILEWPERRGMEGLNIGYEGIELKNGTRWYGSEADLLFGDNDASSRNQHTAWHIHLSALRYQNLLLHLNVEAHEQNLHEWLTDHETSLLWYNTKEILGLVKCHGYGEAGKEKILTRAPFAGLDLIVDDFNEQRSAQSPPSDPTIPAPLAVRQYFANVAEELENPCAGAPEAIAGPPVKFRDQVKPEQRREMQLSYQRRCQLVGSIHHGVHHTVSRFTKGVVRTTRARSEETELSRVINDNARISAPPHLSVVAKRQAEEQAEDSPPHKRARLSQEGEALRIGERHEDESSDDGFLSSAESD